jgi:DNA-binding XRE family transcriptional regulator
MSITVQNIRIDGKAYVILPRREYDRMVKRSTSRSGSAVEDDLPALPKADAQGNRPAIETMRVVIARRLIQDRKAAGLTQQALADQAGVRQETIARIESGKHTASVKTMDKIDNVLSSKKT